MIRKISTLAVLIGLAVSSSADDGAKPQAGQTTPIATSTAVELPDGITNFNGVLVGRLVSKDVEKGRFILTVDAIPRVWRNSKSKNPKSIVGKNVEIDGVFGKWLDVLLLVKPGETLEIEARHDGGNKLTFPGELLRKVAPVQPGDYPELPEEFRGFNGVVIGKIVDKDPELMELILEVESIKDRGKNDKAKNPNVIVGKQIMLAGFWRRKDDYHRLKVGEKIEAGLQHVQTRSDHLTLSEVLRKVDGRAPSSE
jgi:hypothetical protein